MASCGLRLQQHLVTALFKRDIVIIGDRIVTMNRKTIIQKKPRKMETDKTGSAGDKDTFHQVISPMQSRWVGSAPNMIVLSEPQREIAQNLPNDDFGPIFPCRSAQ